MERDESLDDIEAAYQRAMMVVEATEDAFPSETFSSETLSGPTESDRPDRPSEVVESEAAELRIDVIADDAAPVLHPREIIEAALFVGGQSLTTKRLGQMLGSDHAAEHIDSYVDELNATYRNEQRPYQIDFGEGGYRLVLLPEYEPVRSAVFGTGPNEVKLSQDALEVLAFVAYRQPVRAEDVEEAGQNKPLLVLRQLLRRQLVALNRSDSGDVTYSTTSRFLEVFGLRSLDDLPFPEDFELK